jgi:dTDP-4-dehydrorhamnose 3,5-epimerase
MEIVNTEFNDLYLIKYGSFVDERGEFVKTIHAETFMDHNLEYKFSESFYSISNKDVIRGMHYQLPPADHVKLVYVVTGSIIDVVLDIRSNSATFGQFFSTKLSASNRHGLYIGKGFAHGFLALDDNTTVEYHTTSSQNRELEAGVKFDSFGFDWAVHNPIISSRDLNFPTLSELIKKT